MTPVPLFDDFRAFFTARRDACRRLLELSRQQESLILADDYAALLTVLGRKQEALTRLDEMKRANQTLWSRWKAERDALHTSDREDCDHVLAETEALLAALTREEQASTDVLVERRDATRRELEAVSEGVHVHEAYRDTLAPALHRHLDVGR